MRQNRKNTVFLTILTVGLATFAGSGAAAQPPALTATETDGYLQWLHSLEQAVAGRVQADRPEGNDLFPFDLPEAPLGGHRPYRHLSIARAVTELERNGSRRGNGIVQSPLLALSHARSYMHLSEYDSARVWFGTATTLDTAGSFVREITRESLATAIAAGDSLAVSAFVVNTLGASDLDGRESEVVLAFRWLLTQRDSNGLKLLLQKIDGQPVAADERVVYWRAFSLAWLGAWTDSLDLLRGLVAGGGLSHGLNEDERSWVLVAVADMYFLSGSTRVARSLYERLAASTLEFLQTWGRYQVAGLDFLAGDYQRASEGFQAVCDAPRLGTWQDHACAMGPLAAELATIRREGETYGISAYTHP